MYSKELEQLIASVIADGIVTEKERAVLYKRAQAEGVDRDELDVYVDGLLLQRECNKEQTAVSPIETYDESLLHKVSISSGTYYYCGEYLALNDPCLLPKSPKTRIKVLYLTFIKVQAGWSNQGEEYDRHAKSLGGKCFLVLCGDEDGHSDSLSFTLRIDTKYVLTSSANTAISHWTYYHLSKLTLGKLNKGICAFCEVDETVLKRLCEAKAIKIEYSCYDYSETCQCLQVRSSAQLFYRAVVDNSAYSNASKQLAVDNAMWELEDKLNEIERRSTYRDASEDIESLAIPSDKQSMLTMIAMLEKKMKSTDSSRPEYDAYRQKIKETVKQAASRYPSDSQLQALKDKYTKFSWNTLPLGLRIVIIIFGILMLLSIMNNIYI